MADMFIEEHAYSAWKTVPRYAGPAQWRRYRLSQVMPRHPSYFTYAFSGTTMVIMIGKQDEPESVSRDEMQEEESALILSSITADRSPPRQPEKGALEEAHASLLEKPPEEAPFEQQELREIIYMISVGQTVRFFFKEEIEQKESEEERTAWMEVPLNNNTYEAILAFLATRAHDGWVLRNALLQGIFGESGDGDENTKQRDAFLDDRRRIQNVINKTIRERYPHHTIRLESEKKRYSLFENRDKRGSGPQWRLTSQCRIKGMDDLIRWYQQIKEARSHTGTFADGQPFRKIEDWRRIAQQLIKRYSNNYLLKHTQEEEENYIGGYLIQQLYDNPFKRWAPEVYGQSREKYVSILEYIASCEERIWEQTHNDAYLRKAADLYKECAYAATCEPVHQKLGEQALRKCVQLYYEQLQDIEAAEHIYQVYKTRVKKRMVEWTPERQTNELIEQFRLD